MHITTNNSNWSDDKIAKLRRLWEEGLPTAEIGRRLGITKNAVIGKAWRLDLPPAPRFGRPGTANFRFCRQPVLTGKPYCAAHCRISYVRPASAALERDFL